MYSTCLFCHRSLGHNEVIELFPVGRRLAFDAAKGRLWVVCRRCNRWNLTPLEERWEAIELCEAAFRVAPLRVSSDNIGFARVPEGLELVRVGPALRSELAAWRYGQRFRWRRRVTHAVHTTGRVINYGGGHVLSAVASSSAAATLFGNTVLAYAAIVGAPVVAVVGFAHFLSRQVIARILHEDDRVLVVRRRDVRAARLVPDDSGAGAWGLEVRHDAGLVQLHGAAAVRTTGMVLSRLNVSGGSDGEVSAATRRLESFRDAEGLFAGAARIAAVPPRTGFAQHWRDVFVDDAVTRGENQARDRAPEGALARLPLSMRLALEMAAAEDTERRAAEGELVALERAWRDAERIAAIADAMLLPPIVHEWLGGHRRKAGLQWHPENEDSP